jgi:hypothetical protein
MFRGRVTSGGPRAYSAGASNVGNPGGGSLKNVISAPIAEGFVVPSSGFAFEGKAQQLTDYDPGHASRVCGNGLFTVPVLGTSSTGVGILNAQVSANLTPSVLDSRLANIEKVFQFYAIRYCKITFITNLPSSSTVGQFAFGVLQDIMAVGAPTASAVLEVSPSMLTPCWQSASMVYTHTGTKVWECYNSSTANLLMIQAALLGVVNAANGSGVPTSSCGSLYVEYVVDFYEPTSILSSVNLPDQRLLKEVIEEELDRRAMIRSKMVSRSLSTLTPSSSIASSNTVLTPSKISNTDTPVYVNLTGPSVAPNPNGSALQSDGGWFRRS